MALLNKFLKTNRLKLAVTLVISVWFELASTIRINYLRLFWQNELKVHTHTHTKGDKTFATSEQLFLKHANTQRVYTKQPHVPLASAKGPGPRSLKWVPPSKRHSESCFWRLQKLAPKQIHQTWLARFAKRKLVHTADIKIFWSRDITRPSRAIFLFDRRGGKNEKLISFKQWFVHILGQPGLCIQC